MPVQIDAGRDVSVGGSVVDGDQEMIGRDRVGESKKKAGLLLSFVKLLAAIGLGGPAKAVQKLLK